MATELEAAKIKVILDTSAAIEQAEKMGEEEARAKETGRDREQRRERGRAGPSGDRERGGGERDGQGRGGEGTNLGRTALDYGRATASGELWSQLKGTPIVGSALGGLDFASKWVPGVVGGFSPEIGAMLLRAAQEVEKVKAKLEALGDTQEQLKKIAVLQLRFNGGVNAGDLAAMGSKLFRINAALDQQRLQEELLGGYVTRQALTRQMIDSFNEATRLGAGK